ncbi:hypothetical protein [Streptomyces sp. NPDC048527]|uniref:hypothetical protein n=1 Tax=Streptomyces sp. NPDC048527 TaxID=3365568 RepID=UPI003716A66D
MTGPHQPRNEPHFIEPPPAVPADAPGAQALLESVRRLRRRQAGPLLTGYLVFAAISSAAPDVLHRRIAGHLSVALLLLLLQLALIAWTLLGHNRGYADVDAATDRYRRGLAEHTRRAAP